MTEANGAKSERINLRLNPAIKLQIERAASFEGKTVSGFIVSSAVESAERAIREYQTFTRVAEKRNSFSTPSPIRPPPTPGSGRRYPSTGAA